jgi:hypothetical protein
MAFLYGKKQKKYSPDLKDSFWEPNPGALGQMLGKENRCPEKQYAHGPRP